MISHKHKVIFIHIPKTAGSSIFKFFHNDLNLDWQIPNYEVLYGWCPKRKIHLQHATSKQLLDLGLVTEEQWNTYFKFTFVRNPWDRAYSDYLWMQRDTNINDSFQNFILKKGNFFKILNNSSNKEYRGDHLLNQTIFFEIKGRFRLNFIGRFENFNSDFSIIKNHLKIKKSFNYHEKKSNERLTDYKQFYTYKNKKLVSKIFYDDINLLGYKF
ncbi:sulfotransferase family 2 domain-containing protein [Lutibacter sp. B1]|uniref:sulfotransferase family 2 domain-containing protein n=1 Tax=Lutibacter sp. B1 TaxID=2725996 RepID=UPI0014566234|nr:sulfotransferase family 2 domain-containing protein [Lutibacter sp. B1]NLP58171.1 sulfotransferase family protein [Lutibacter sp. B1]